MGGTQSGMAQTIDELLLEKAVSPVDVAGMMEEDGKTPVYVYLYNVTNKKFVHGGGEFGAQAVLSDRGIRFKVTKIGEADNVYYRLESAIYNSSHDGGCLGVDVYKKDNSGYKIYIDKGSKGEGVSDTHFRVDDISGITFESTGSGKNRYYLTTTISRNDGVIFPSWNNYKLYYSYVDNSNGEKYVHASTTGRDEWCLIKRDDYNTILGNVAQQGRYNITGLVGNSRFLRNVSDEKNLFWSVTNLNYYNDDYCTTIHPMLGAVTGDTNNDNYARNYGAFGCLEIGAVDASEDSPVEFYQEIKGLTPGLYMVEAQAFFDKNDYATYKNGAYNTPNTTDASNAYLFANGEETLIPVLNSTDQATFETYTTTLKNALNPDNQIYFRRNVAAAYFLAQENEYEPDESFHRVRVYVNVTADEGQETGTLRLGVNKKGTEGRVYVDNFGLYYVGQNEIGLDAYQRVESEVDKNTYFQPYPFHLSRKFVLNEWNAITLPCDVTGSQIIETFGDDAKLCKLEGVNPQNKDQILFSTVSLTDNYSTPAIVHGECYLIWVTKGPVWEENKEYTFLVKKENDPNQTSQNMTFPYGNIYTINGVSCPDGISMVTPETNYKTVTTATGTLKYTYFYHRPDNAPAGSYVMSGGKMYHIPEAWTGLLGTCWYITEENPTSGRSLMMAIDGEGGTTDINGIVTEVPGDKAMEGVYNINGQKVADGTSLEGLPKGIYIVNGKKHVVK